MTSTVVFDVGLSCPRYSHLSFKMKFPKCCPSFFHQFSDFFQLIFALHETLQANTAELIKQFLGFSCNHSLKPSIHPSINPSINQSNQSSLPSVSLPEWCLRTVMSLAPESLSSSSNHHLLHGKNSTRHYNIINQSRVIQIQTKKTLLPAQTQ